MIDSDSSSPYSSAEKLALLFARRQAWANLELSNPKTTRVNILMDGTCSAYELVGGVFAKIMPENIGQQQPQQQLQLQLPQHFQNADVARYFYAVGLPGGSHGGRTVKYDTEIPTRDFAIDPSQDLIAFLQADG